MAMETVTFLMGDITTEPSMITTFADESVDMNDLSGIGNTHNESLDVNSTVYYDYETKLPLFETFASLEIAMTALELIISIIAALKIPRWTKNYRNQMLMQLSLARFVKRVVYYVEYLQETPNADASTVFSVVLFGVQTYIDFVIVILVVFFIKHMYDSLIVVIVKINQDSLFKKLSFAWLLPIPISAAWAGIISADVMDEWLVYLLICCILRWPIILIGTWFYITILYKVFTDKIRRFARSLTIITFLICLIVNLYLFSKDVIELWCIKSFSTVLVNYILGFLLNLSILCFYLILIIQNYKKKTKSTTSLPQYSIEREVK